MLPFTLSHVSVFLLTVMTTATITTIIFYTGIGPRGAFVVLVQNLGQIMSNIVKKVKKQAISLDVFSYFTWGIPFKAKSSGCKTT